MFDARAISQAIGPQALAAINLSSLPKQETLTLLQIWTHSSRRKLAELAKSGNLVPTLTGQHKKALELANETRLHSPHLTSTECLQAAGLPLAL